VVVTGTVVVVGGAVVGDADDVVVGGGAAAGVAAWQPDTAMATAAKATRDDRRASTERTVAARRG
jgi:hypothetical protein